MLGSIPVRRLRQELKGVLEEKITQYQLIVDRHQSLLQQNGGESSADPMDHASTLENSSNDATCISLLKKALQEAEETLRAIKKQQEPECKDCGKPIGWERLAAAQNLLCLRCAEAKPKRR